jgi:Glycosyl hydrolases family 16
MNAKNMLIISTVAALLAGGAMCHAGTIRFSGYTWDVRPSGSGGPGPNNWDQNNVWVDGRGYLHLRLTKRNNRWYCSEVSTQNRLGFGRYQFWIVGRVDKLDKNVVFGLFNYPTSDVGPDGTHEIDIEFAKWGSSSARIGNYTVWPATTGVSRGAKTFSFTLNGDWSTHRFTWSPQSVFFQSQHGHYDNNSYQFASWLYQPRNPTTYISRKPMPVHINLWCYDGRAPSNGQQVEVVVRAFKFTPM